MGKTGRKKLVLGVLLALTSAAGLTSAAAAQTLFDVRLVPLAEGWSQSQVNAVIFRKNSVVSHGDFQYAAFYDAVSRVVVAKRRRPARKWEIKTTGLTGDPRDAHNSISLAVDGRGFLHLAWNHHDVPLNYRRGTRPGALDFEAATPMIGADERRVSYPEFYRLPDGDLLFLYRDGASGNGRLVLNRYAAKTGKWTRVQSNLIDGEGRRSAYPQMTVDARGSIHLSWVWRESPDVATNHDLCYARSDDGGKTWRASSGGIYRLPIRAATAEYVRRVAPGSELINQTSMAADARGRVYIATYWRDAGSTVPQYRLVHFDGRAWRASQISARSTPFSLSGRGTKRILIARPLVIVETKRATPRVLVIFRDAERGGRVSAAVSDDLDKDVWKIFDLADADVGLWEPTFDAALWERRRELHLFVQKVGQGDGETLENIAPQPISIMEVRPRS